MARVPVNKQPHQHRFDEDGYCAKCGADIQDDDGLYNDAWLRAVPLRARELDDLQRLARLDGTI